MASFCTTFHSMRKNDIKHTYYGKPISMEYRAANEYSNLEQMRRSEEEKNLKHRVLQGKTTSYRNYQIPAAPAFRALSRDDVDDITRRLRHTTTASDGPTQSADDRQVCEVGRSRPRFLGMRKLNPAELELSTRRLCTMTHMARLRAEHDAYKQVVIVNGAIPSDSIPVREARLKDGFSKHEL